MKAPRTSSNAAAYLFLFPACAVLFTFAAAPIIYAVGLSLSHYTAGGVFRFTGLRNYGFALSDPTFWQSVVTTGIYTLGSAVLGIFFALLFALLLSRRAPGIGAFRTLLFIPAIFSDAVIGMLFQWVYATDGGLLNRALALIDVPAVPWITNTAFALPSVILMGTWVGAAYNTPILLNGLHTIPPQLYEAARLDGARGLSRFFHVTLPLLRPFVLYVFIMAVIGSFQVFGRIFVLTGGGPVDATLVSVQYIYRVAFTYNQLGYAATLSVILFVLLGGLVLVQWRLLDRQRRPAR